jgi:ligand-binding SRPBCC domain-containing protein
MVTVARAIRIDAPVTDVFAFLDVPDNQVRVTPSLESVRDVERLPDGGKRLGYTYRVAGVPVSGVLETSTYDPPERIVFEFVEGLLTGRIEWTLEAVGDEDAPATRFVYRATYGFRLPLVGAVAAPLVRRLQAREVETALRATKRRIERPDQSPTTADRERSPDDRNERDR